MIVSGSGDIVANSDRLSRRALLAGFGATALGPALGLAQSPPVYPTRTVSVVVPFAAGGFPLLGDSSVLYAEAPNPRLDTVHMDSPTGAVFIDSPTQLAHFRSRLDLAEKVALTPEKSRELICGIARDL